MKLSISNITWGKQLDEELLSFLKNSGADAIELAPGLIDWSNEQERIKSIRQLTSATGLKISGFHAILYERKHWRIVNRSHWSNIFAYLKLLAERCVALGAKVLVFGSPPSRNLEDMCPEDGMKLAEEFFTRLGDYCASTGAVFVIEPLPQADLIKTTSEAAKLIKKIALPDIRLHLEVRTLEINKENPEEIVKQNANLIEHVHTGGLDLTFPDNNDGINHARYGKILRKYNYNEFIAIESVRKTDIPDYDLLQSTLEFMRKKLFKNQ